MSGKVFFKKVLSSVLCLALILSVIGGLSFSVSAADYNWGANWRYKTSEGGEWQYPASDKDVTAPDISGLILTVIHRLTSIWVSDHIRVCRSMQALR